MTGLTPLRVPMVGFQVFHPQFCPEQERTKVGRYKAKVGDRVVVGREVEAGRCASERIPTLSRVFSDCLTCRALSSGKIRVDSQKSRSEAGRVVWFDR